MKNLKSHLFVFEIPYPETVFPLLEKSQGHSKINQNTETKGSIRRGQHLCIHSEPRLLSAPSIFPSLCLYSMPPISAIPMQINTQDFPISLQKEGAVVKMVQSLPPWKHKWLS